MGIRNEAGGRHRNKGTRASSLFQRIQENGFLNRFLHLPGITHVVSVLRGVTPLGWTLLWGGVALLVLGMKTGWPEVTIPAAGAVGLFLGALIHSFISSVCDVELLLPENRVPVGEGARGEIVLRNTLSRPVRPVLISLIVEKEHVDVWSPPLGASEEHREPFLLATNQRGKRRIGPVHTSSGDPFGIVRRVRTTSEVCDLWVHPRTVNLEIEAVGFIRDLEGVVTQDLSSADVSFRALRDYIAGDDRRDIHWRTTARVGRFMVRQFEETKRAHMLIVLDVNAASWTPESFELGVSVAGSVARSSFRESVALSLHTQAGHMNSATLIGALDALAEVSLIKETAPLDALTRIAAAENPAASLALVVTGPWTPVRDIHRALCRMRPDLRLLALRVDPSAESSVAVVGGFPLLVLSELEQLPALMRRVLA